jgi:hypothetical protein
MNDSNDFTDPYRRHESHLKGGTQQSIVEKMAIATRPREAQEKLAPVRAANIAKHRAGQIKIRYKTI